MPDGLKERLMKSIPMISEVSWYDESLEDLTTRQTYTSTERHIKPSTEVLADHFAIGLHRAKETLKATLQRGTRSAILPISRRYRADRQYGIKRLNGKFATDTLWAKTRSLRGYIAAQIYSHKNGFCKAYPIDRADNERIGYSLSTFVNEFGAPNHLTYDGAAVQVGRNTLFQQNVRKYEIKTHVSAPRRPNENPAEGAIREIKRKWYRMQAKKNIPDRLWDFGIEYICETSCLTINSSRYSKGRVPLEIITGETPDISEYLDFGFYGWITYKTNAGLGIPELGRWLGVSHRVGKLMSYWILTEHGTIVSCSTVQRLTNLEKQQTEYKDRMNEFQKKLEQKWTTTSADLSEENYLADIPAESTLCLEDEDEDFIKEYNKVIESNAVKHIEDYVDHSDDPYTSMELGLNLQDEEGLHHAVVKKRAVDEDGKPIGIANNNPLLDS